MKSPYRFLPVLLALLPAHAVRAGAYVTEASGIRWNDVGGIRWNDVGGIRWNDVGGIRWNDVGGIRWNDVGGTFFSEAFGIRWNDVGGIRWNDAGSIEFVPPAGDGATIDLEALGLLSSLPDSSALNVIVTYRAPPTISDLLSLQAAGILGGTKFRRLPMVVVNATRSQIAAIASRPSVRSVWANRTLSIFDQESRALIGLDEAAADPDLVVQGGGAPTGAGVTIAVIDTGVDATHPDLPYGSKVVQNVRLLPATGIGLGFPPPLYLEGIVNTDLVQGHGTFVASVAAGSGAASGGRYRGAAPGASILSLSAGDLFIVDVLEGFDYVLDNRIRFNVRVLNCSWGTTGFFDPDDPVNIATRLVHDAGVTVVFAAGNHGPSGDTLNAYGVAPWVVGVGSSRKDGTLSSFSSRGIFEELLYHPTLIGPGEGIIAASPLLLNAVYGIVGVADLSGGSSVPPQDALLYSVASGTSFAAPHVAGVAALMIEKDPTLTPAQVKRILQETAVPILSRDRSEVGAGGLDAWAALARVADPVRPFGTHIPGWLDERPFRIDHAAPSITSATVPAGGVLRVPLAIAGDVLAWRAALAWGDFPGLGDLDVRLVDASESEIVRSETFNGHALFGRAEGVQLLGPPPPGAEMEVYFKPLTGLFDQHFEVRQETSSATLTAFTDLEGLSAEDLRTVTNAVARRLMIGNGAHFKPHQSLERGELVRALALAAGLPQRIPAAPTFADVDAGHPDHPYVESAAGTRARRVLVDPRSPGEFEPDAPASRLEFAVSMVRAAGRQDEALARAGEPVAVTDSELIPSGLRGYAAVALERGFIETVATPQGEAFDPQGSLTRLSAASYLPRLLAPKASSP